MFLKIVPKKNIVKVVTNEIKNAKKEILATMLLSEEIAKPLPDAYHVTLNKKLEEGILLKRLGFGSREGYNTINQKYRIKHKRYSFRYLNDIQSYQRLLIVDRKRIFFKVGNIFLESTHEQIIAVFLEYFNSLFREGKL